MYSKDFNENLRLCREEFMTLQKRFKLTMDILMRALSQTKNKRGEVKFLDEAYIRLNFNNFYMDARRQDAAGRR